jgi:hypothetical protein
MFRKRRGWKPVLNWVKKWDRPSMKKYENTGC